MKIIAIFFTTIFGIRLKRLEKTEESSVGVAKSSAEIPTPPPRLHVSKTLIM
jgi:hypothetical protein